MIKCASNTTKSEKLFFESFNIFKFLRINNTLLYFKDRCYSIQGRGSWSDDIAYRVEVVGQITKHIR